ncbi:hypothetical protein [Metabacillus niabensis]|uniref:Uncharacterized protein n=1 Tax=Metabacillus niabensis TaxID=324854 RepID=A0ABT9Z9Z7_9BACI|nr:hypothetical protein [Metabacillus niabensis]MDQ0228438.1 hypothetical protein [Metabacillus niabensis]
MNYSKMPLIQLHELCKKNDQLALNEYKRRWGADWPNVGIPAAVLIKHKIS